MGKIERFEDLDCWKSARELVRLVYSSCACGKLARDFETRGQFKRAALSTMNNIAEGFGRNGDKDSIRFFDISQSSAIEVKSMTYVLQDAGYLPADEIERIRKKADDTKSLTLGLIRYLRNRIAS